MEIYFINDSQIIVNTSIEEAYSYWAANYSRMNHFAAIFIDGEVKYAILPAFLALYKTQKRPSQICCTIIRRANAHLLNIIE